MRAVMLGRKRTYGRKPFVEHVRWEIVEYSWPKRAEIAVLENIWRDKVRVSQLVSIALVFWHILPVDLIKLILSKQKEEWRVSDVLPLKEGNHAETTMYKLKLHRSERWHTRPGNE